MLRHTLIALASRLRRTALTLLVVAVGVAMIAGAFVFTDTIHASFRQLFAGASAGAQLTVAGRHAINSDPSAAPGISAGVVSQIQRLPGVAAARGEISDVATIVDRRGRAIGGGRLGTLALTYLPPPFDGVRILTGAAPNGIGDVVVDARTARQQGFRVGDLVPVVTGDPVRRFRLTGIATLGGASPGGERFVAFTLPAAEHLFDKPGSVDEIAVALKRGASATAVAGEIRSLLPRQLVVRGRDAQVSVEVERVSARLASLTTGLLAFALVAVLVGALLVFNSFAATGTQRARELSILRALGATRAQVLESVLLESAIVGLLGGAIGLAVGPLAALLMQALFDPTGVGLSSVGVVLGVRTILVSLGVGLGMAVLAALPPAFRSARSAPVEALGPAGPPLAQLNRPRLRTLLAAAFMGGGLALILTAGGSRAERLRTCAIGGGLLVLAVLVIGPLLVRLLAGPLTWPLERRGGLVARLARDQMLRSPTRTALSASSLTIGLALVLVLSTYANGLRAATRAAVHYAFVGDIAIQSADGTTPIPAASVRAVATTPGVVGLASLRTAEARLGAAGDVQVSGVDPTEWPQIYRFRWGSGGPSSFAGLGAGEVLLEQDTARAAGLRAGARTVLTTGSGLRVPVTVSGIYRDDGLLRGVVMASGWFVQVFHQPRLEDVFVRLGPGASGPTALATLRGALRPFPGVVARSQAQTAAVAERQAGVVVGLVYGLLALSLLMSLVGITGTLSLGVHERTRELGVLRALGMAADQVASLVRDESVVTACVGALSGLVLGLALGWAVTHALAPEGFAFIVPWDSVGLVIAAGLGAGVVAAFPPARRAARIDILLAIAHE